MATKTTTGTSVPQAELDLEEGTRTGFGFDLASMSRLNWAAAGLATITGAIHVYLYVMQGFAPFLFAGVVFFAAIAGLLVIPRGHLARRAIYALGIPFTGGQIAMWVSLGMPDFALGVADKSVQVALIVVLAYLLLTER